MKLVHVKCNLCGAGEEDLLYEVFGSKIVKCRVCGLVYINPRPGKHDLTALYDENYFSNTGYQQNDESQYFGYNEYISDEENIMRKFKRKIEQIERFVKPGALLDIGCACGFFMNLAHSRGWSVSGIEPSSFAADYARNRFGFEISNKFSSFHINFVL